MPEPGSGLVSEGPVPVVHIQHVIWRDVVRDVDVGPAVAGEIGDRDTQAIADIPHDTRLLGHVRERAVTIVAVESIVALRRGPMPPGRAHLERALEVSRGIIEQKEVEIAIAVIVEPYGLRTESAVGNAILRRRFGESPVPVVDEEQVTTCGWNEPRRSGNTHIDVEQPVVVDVHEADARCPSVRRHACGRGDVLELHVAQVPVQPARHHVARKEDVGLTVVIDVPYRHTSAVVDVRIGQRVQRIAGGDGVGERDPRLRRGQPPEQRRWRRRRTLTARQQND